MKEEAEVAENERNSEEFCRKFYEQGLKMRCYRWMKLFS